MWFCSAPGLGLRPFLGFFSELSSGRINPNLALPMGAFFSPPHSAFDTHSIANPERKIHSQNATSFGGQQRKKCQTSLVFPRHSSPVLEFPRRAFSFLNFPLDSSEFLSIPLYEKKASEPRESPKTYIYIIYARVRAVFWGCHEAFFQKNIKKFFLKVKNGKKIPFKT